MSFTLDALARHGTRTVGGTLSDTYTYAGSSEAIVRIDQPSGAINSIVNAVGSRLAVATTGGGFGWTLSDLHGDIAGYADSAGTGVTDAFRYDPYGEQLASQTSGLAAPWRYQGRLLESTPGDTDLYDFVFRAYAPDLGAFTSPDDEAGKALAPITFNRYLYAGANPATMVDPDGHCFVLCAVVGAVVGAVVTAATDVVSGQGLNIQNIAAGAVGGAAFGTVLGTTGNVWAAGAAGGAASELTNQAWNYVASGGKKGFDLGRVGQQAAMGAAFGKASQLAARVVSPLASRAAQALGRRFPTLSSRFGSMFENRATQIHRRLDARAQRSRTTAVAPGRNGLRPVATVGSSSGRRIPPSIRDGLHRGEVAVRGLRVPRTASAFERAKGHAEQVAERGLRAMGVRARTVYVSRPPCRECQDWARRTGIRIVVGRPARPWALPAPYLGRRRD